MGAAEFVVNELLAHAAEREFGGRRALEVGSTATYRSSRASRCVQPTTDNQSPSPNGTRASHDRLDPRRPPGMPCAMSTIPSTLQADPRCEATRPLPDHVAKAGATQPSEYPTNS